MMTTKLLVFLPSMMIIAGGSWRLLLHFRAKHTPRRYWPSILIIIGGVMLLGVHIARAIIE